MSPASFPFPFCWWEYFTSSAAATSRLWSPRSLVYCIYYMGTKLQLFAPWLLVRDYCDWIGMVRKLAQIACLAQETAKGMMGNKDIIECKLLRREGDTARRRGNWEQRSPPSSWCWHHPDRLIHPSLPVDDCCVNTPSDAIFHSFSYITAEFFFSL